EELPRRGRDAVRAGAEVYLVQVQVEDVVLGERALEALGEDGLLHLALEAALGRQEERLHDLLRDRAAALYHPVAREIGPQRAQYAGRIDAAVAVELGVLGGEEREPHVLRDTIERHEIAALGVELADQRSVVR